MSKCTAILLGMFTAWPPFYIILFMYTVFDGMSDFSDGHSSGLSLTFDTIFCLHILTMLEIAALLVIYITYLFRTDRVTQDKKALWAIVLLLGHVIAMPIFWYLYIWKEPQQGTPEKEARGDA